MAEMLNDRDIPDRAMLGQLLRERNGTEMDKWSYNRVREEAAILADFGIDKKYIVTGSPPQTSPEVQEWLRVFGAMYKQHAGESSRPDQQEAYPGFGLQAGQTGVAIWYWARRLDRQIQPHSTEPANGSDLLALYIFSLPDEWCGQLGQCRWCLEWFWSNRNRVFCPDSSACRAASSRNPERDRQYQPPKSGKHIAVIDAAELARIEKLGEVPDLESTLFQISEGVVVVLATLSVAAELLPVTLIFASRSDPNTLNSNRLPEMKASIEEIFRQKLEEREAGKKH
jgi:hypothetical protein